MKTQALAMRWLWMAMASEQPNVQFVDCATAWFRTAFGDDADDIIIRMEQMVEAQK